MAEHDDRPVEEPEEPEAADPSGAYSGFPGRTGKPPEGDRPADETVPPDEPER